MFVDLKTSFSGEQCCPWASCPLCLFDMYNVEPVKKVDKTLVNFMTPIHPLPPPTLPKGQTLGIISVKLISFFRNLHICTLTWAQISKLML